MRTAGAAALLLCAVAFQPSPVLAQEACGPGKLGVARTVTIDASSAPHLGGKYQSRKGKALLADGEVALTFDDGPSRNNTRSILDTLAAQCTKATFFMVGRRALAEPDMVKEVAARGHTVATHTWSHARLDNASDAKALSEIELGFSAVQMALGRPIAPFFRFPYLRDSAFSLAHLDSRQVATISIDIDSRDFETRDPGAVHARVIADVTARRRGIILFHDIHASTAQALPLILADLKSLGFRIVHLAPKAGLETDAEHDKLAQQEAMRRHLATARSPLAKRSITWPLGGPAGLPAGGGAADAQDAQALTKAAKTVTGGKPDDVASEAADAATGSALKAPSEDWAADLWNQTQ